MAPYKSYNFFYDLNHEQSGIIYGPEYGQPGTIKFYGPEYDQPRTINLYGPEYDQPVIVWEGNPGIYSKK